MALAAVVGICIFIAAFNFLEKLLSNIEKLSMNFPDNNFRGVIPGPSGDLEIAVDFPRGLPDNGLIFIMCHPNPLEGGTMDNKVVTTATRAMNKLGLVSIRFNFRGVGKSAGIYGDRLGECEDLRAVIAWVKAHRSGSIWLGGFSFGSYIAYACANEKDLGVAQLLTIAPAVNRWDYKNLPAPSMPWLCIVGDQDEVVPSHEVFEFIYETPATVNLIKFFETGHFFHQRLVLLDQKITEYYRGCLK